MSDSYQVLGVARTATDEEIKARFRKLAMEFHPDRHVASSKSVCDANAIRFREISEAYEKIGDKEARRVYDAARAYAGAGGGGRRGGPFGSPYGPSAGPRHSYYHGENPYGPNFRKGSGFRARPAGATSFSSQLFTLAMRSQTLNLFLGGTAAFFVLSGAAWDYLWRSHNQGRSWREVESKLVQEELEKYRARAAQAARADAEAVEARAASSAGTGPVTPVPPPPPSQIQGEGAASSAPPGPSHSVATTGTADRAQEPEATRGDAGIASTASAASQPQPAGASSASGAGGGSRGQGVQGARETERASGTAAGSASFHAGPFEAGLGGASAGVPTTSDLGVAGSGPGLDGRSTAAARATAGG